MRIQILYNIFTSLSFSRILNESKTAESAISKDTGKYFPEFERVDIPPLLGKVVVITGCTSGTGFVAAQCAARKGAEAIFMLNRVSERATLAEQVVQEQVPIASLSKTYVETIPCDLQDMKSVKEAIRSIKSKCDKIDVLCNNAGVMALEDVATKDGYDIQMQTNHLSHFLLTKELLPLIQKSSDGRIVNHSSMARQGSPLKAEYFGKNGGNLGGNDGSFFSGGRYERYVFLEMNKRQYCGTFMLSGFFIVDKLTCIIIFCRRYHQTKLANSCFTLALANKIKEAGIHNVKAVCAAPGWARTNLFASGGMEDEMKSSGNSVMNAFSGLVMGMAQSPEDGAMPLLTAMFGTKTKNGDFYEPRGLGGISGKPRRVEYDKNSASLEQQRMLWELSELVCGDHFTL